MQTMITVCDVCGAEDKADLAKKTWTTMHITKGLELTRTRKSLVYNLCPGCTEKVAECLFPDKGVSNG